MAMIDVWQRQILPQGGAGSAAINRGGEIIGRAISQAGQDLGDFAKDVVRADQIKQAQQDEIDQGATLNAVLKFGNDFDTLQAERRKQAQPGAPDFTAASLKDFDKMSQDVMANVPVRQKDYATAQLLRLRNDVQGQADRFEIASKGAYAKQQVGEILNQGATYLVTNPTRLNFVTDQVTEKVRALGLSAQDEQAALADVNGTLKTALLGGWVQRNPRAAMTAIDAGKFGDVPADKLLSLRGQAESKIKQEETLARVEANMRQQVAQGDLLGRLDIVLPALAQTGVVPVDSSGQPLVSGPEEILALFPGRRGEALARQFQQSQLEGQDRLSILDTNLFDDYAKRDSMLPAPGQGWSAEERQRYESFARAVAAKEELLSKDPAAAVMASPALRQAWETRASLASTPGADPKMVQQATQTAVNATIQAQIDLGAAPWQAKPLTKAQAQAYAGSLRTGTPESIKAVSQEIMSLGPAAVGQVIAAGAPSGFAAMTAIDDPLLVNQFAQVMVRPEKDFSDILSAKGVSRSAVEGAVAEELGPLYATMPPDSIAPYQRAFTDLAIDQLGRGASDETVAAQSVTASLLAGYQFDGHLRVPADLSLRQVKAGLAMAMTDLVTGKAGIQADPPPGFDSMGALQEAAVNGGLVWYTNETGDGAILATPEGRWIPVVVRTSNNRAVPGRYEIKFADAARRGMQP